MRTQWFSSLLLVLCLACAHGKPLPSDYQGLTSEQLKSKINQRTNRLNSFSAEVRLTYFGPEGRLKTTASLLVARPASLRYELQGPHGGALAAFATNGLELELMDLSSHRFVYGPATAPNIDALMNFAPLGLVPNEWVSLLFGAVEIPTQAAVDYNAKRGVFVASWTTKLDGKNRTRRLEFDRESLLLTRMTMLADKTLLSDVEFQSRTADGLPSELEIKIPDAKVHLRASLHDIEIERDFDPNTFVLEPTSDMVLQHTES